MTLTLYKNSSDNEVLDKSLETIESGVEFLLLDGCSEFSPVLTLRNRQTAREANYLYINEWGKYYYINDRNYDNNGIITISASEDVLMSFKDAIRATEQNITRSEDPKVYNLYINDPRMQALTKMQVQQKVFGNDVFNVGDMTLTDENFLLTTINAPRTTQTAGD